jgi:hypothetical protein
MPNPNDNLPFEVGLEKAKDEILTAVNQIGAKYKIPTALLTMILSSIATETKLNTYETIIAAYDISSPENSVSTPPKSNTPQNKPPSVAQPTPQTPSVKDGAKK